VALRASATRTAIRYSDMFCVCERARRRRCAAAFISVYHCRLSSSHAFRASPVTPPTKLSCAMRHTSFARRKFYTQKDACFLPLCVERHRPAFAEKRRQRARNNACRRARARYAQLYEMVRGEQHHSEDEMEMFAEIAALRCRRPPTSSHIPSPCQSACNALPEPMSPIWPEACPRYEAPCLSWTASPMLVVCVCLRWRRTKMKSHTCCLFYRRKMGNATANILRRQHAASV